MPSNHTKINRTIDSLSTFLKYHRADFFESWRELKPSKGWNFESYEDELTTMFSNLYGNLYDRLAPLLDHENPSTDRHIYDIIVSMKKYTEEKLEWFSKTHKEDPDIFDNIAITEIYGYFELSFYALQEAIILAEEDLAINSIHLSDKSKNPNNKSIAKPSDKTIEQQISKKEICIITTTDKETETVKSLLTDVVILPKDSYDSNIYFKGNYKGNQFILTKSQFQGSTFAAVSTTKMISKFKPKYIAMLGYAAGNRNRKDDIAIGDILICQTAVDYNQIEVRQIKQGETEIKIENIEKKIPYHTDPYLFGQLNSFSYNEKLLLEIKESYGNSEYFKCPLNAHTGKFITGSALIRSDVEITRLLKQNSGTISLDMETYGFYVACEHSFIDEKPKYVAIKSVSDYGGHTDSFKGAAQKYDPKVDRPEERQKYAAYTSAKFFLEFAKQHLND